MPLRIASYNIHRCIGRDGIENPDRIAGVLREIDADIIALQEVASLVGSPKNVLALLADAATAKVIPGFTLVEKNGRYGNAILSKIEVSRVNRVDISVPGREPRGVLAVDLDINHCKVAFFATHLGLTPRERRLQIRHILSLLKKTIADVSILLGDFNEWLFWGRPLRWLKQWFTPMPTPSTFPAHYPLLALDRIWIHPATRLMSLQVHATALSRIASDHLPLVADVDL